MSTTTTGQSAGNGLDADEDSRVKAWERFLKAYYKVRVNEIVLQYPACKSVEIDYWDVDKHDPDLAADLLDQPQVHLEKARAALQTIDLPAMSGPRPDILPRFVRLPETHQFHVNELRKEHSGKLVAVRGVVQKTTEILSLVTSALFRSTRPGCDALIREPQDDPGVQKTPTECYEDEGGCGRQHGFQLVTEDVRGQVSETVDWQLVTIQELPEHVTGTRQPGRLDCYLREDITGVLEPGEKVTLNGIVRRETRRSNQKATNILERRLHVVSIERDEEDAADQEPTPEEEELIREYAARPDVVDQLARNLAPGVDGHEWPKKGAILALFGAPTGQTPDGERVRGEVHVLFIGDPATAKSKIMKSAIQWSPRGIVTNSKGASGPGLVGAVTKDKTSVGGDRWVHTAGPLALASGGHLGIEELDKASKEVLNVLPEPMEDGEYRIDKADVHVTLRTVTGVFATANPVDGRWSQFGNLAEQFGLDPFLVSRFDLIFPFRDARDADQDRRIVRAVISKRGLVARGANGTLTPGEGAPEFQVTLLRKWIALARRHYHPVLAEDVQRVLEDDYVMLRGKGRATNGEDAPVSITARQADALVRLSQAAARVRLSHTVELRDFRLAQQVFGESYGKIATNAKGVWDADRVSGSRRTSDDRSAIEIVKDVIWQATAEGAQAQTRKRILTECERAGLPRAQAEHTFDEFETFGIIMQHGDGWLLTKPRGPRKARQANDDETTEGGRQE